MAENETGDVGELPGSVLYPAKGRIGLRWLIHFRVAIGVSVSEKIKAPNVEPGIAQRITPGMPVEPMRDRKAGREGRAMHVKHRRHVGRTLLPGRKVPQKELHARTRARDPVMLLARVEFLEACLKHDETLEGKKASRRFRAVPSHPLLQTPLVSRQNAAAPAFDPLTVSLFRNSPNCAGVAGGRSWGRGSSLRARGRSSSRTGA